LIPIFGTSAVLVAPPAPLISSGYVAGNTLVAQHFNYQLFHLTKELNNVLIAAGVVQNATVDTQLRDSILTLIYSLTGQGYLALNAGSPYSLLLSNPLYGTIDVTTGASQFIINLPSAVTAFAIGYEADFRKADSGAGKLTLQLANSADYLANVLNGTWDVTEQYGHVKIRAVQVAGVYGYQVQSCDGTVYRNVATSSSTASTAINVWTNQGGSLALGPGVYELSWSGGIAATDAANTQVAATLSTDNNSETDIDFTAFGLVVATNTPYPGYRRKRVVVLANATYYLNVSNPSGTHTIGFAAGAAKGNTIIEAKRVG
jgi:hypothetical protein